jgi:hypothetical protein
MLAASGMIGGGWRMGPGQEADGFIQPPSQGFSGGRT